MNTLSNRPGNDQVDELIKRMNMIFFAIIGGVVVFAVIALYMIEVEKKEISPELDETFKIIVPLLALAGAFASRFLYTMLIKKAIEAPANQKGTQYQTAMLIRLALLEGPALFAIVSYLLTANTFYLIIVAALVILMILQKPSKLRYEEELFSSRQ